MAVSLTAIVFADTLDLDARGFTTREGAEVLVLVRVEVREVVRFMISILATSMPVVPVPATLV